MLYSFAGGSQGAYPATNVVVGPSGTIFGGTQQGGDSGCNPPYGCGVIYLVTPSGKETVLHRFAGSATGDGSGPAGLILNPASRTIYGNAAGGGTNSSECVNGCGAVFKIDSTGKETILHSFTGPPDANLPLGSLILGPAGNLYGVSFYGGGPSNGTAGPGTVFEIDKAGVERVFYAFTAPPNGTDPNGSFVRDSGGNFYGTITYGGAGACNNGFLPGCGIVFKVDPAGQETVLYSFTGGSDGGYPSALVLDAAGNLYGASSGNLNGNGLIFRLDPAGNFTVLYNFTGGADGTGATNLILGPAGSLYGTAQGGNSACNGGCGLVFQLSPNGTSTWTDTVLHSFNGADGNSPIGVTLKSGAIYGSTYQGGASNYGAVFKLVP